MALFTKPLKCQVLPDEHWRFKIGGKAAKNHGISRVDLPHREKGLFSVHVMCATLRKRPMRR